MTNFTSSLSARRAAPGRSDLRPVGPLRPRRPLLAGVGLAAMLAALFVPTGASANAQEAFAVGSGRASAKYMKVGPARGSLSLAPTVGLSLSDFLNTRGRGDVRTADFAALGDSLPPEVTGEFPVLKVESTDENSEAGTTTATGTGADATELSASAGDEPFGRSSFRTAPVDLEAVAVGGGIAETFSGVVEGNLRESVGSVRIGKLDIGAGALVMEGLEWRAVHRTGAKSEETGTFTVGSISVGGDRTPAPPGSEQPLEDAIVAAAPLLGPLGIEISLPKARIEGGISEITALRIRIANSDAGPATAPVIEGAQPARDAVVDGVRGGTEDADAALLVGDVALGVLAGGSTLDIELGGATAQTAEPASRFSFGAGAAGFDLSAGGAGTGAALSTAFGGSSSGAGSIKVPAALGLSPSATPSGAKSSAAPATSSSGSTTAGAVPISTPSGGDGGAGPLLPVGLAGLGAALAAGSVDYRRLLRRPILA